MGSLTALHVRAPGTAPPGVAGALIGWGDDLFGQAAPPPLTDITAVAAGGWHGLALHKDGSVIGWGFDEDGRALPPAVLGHHVTAIAAGGYHSLALCEDGTVYGWGDDTDGQAGPPPDLGRVIAIAGGGYHSLALRENGTVVGWGYDDYGQASPPETLDHVVAIAAGGWHSVALRDDGTVVGWGDDDFGQASAPPASGQVVAVAAGYYHTLVLRADGTVACWSRHPGVRLTPPPGLRDVVAIAARGNHNLALCADGSVVGWGDDDFGQTDGPPSAERVVALATGYYHSLAITVPAGAPQPPRLVLPGDITAEAAGPSGAAVHYDVSVNADVSATADAPRPSLVVDPPSGSIFALGHTTVTVEARDAHGTRAEGSFDVHVVDTKAPTVTAPDLTVFAAGSAGVTVAYTGATARDLVDGALPVSFDPPSGSTLPIGRTRVQAYATDAHGNTGRTSFTVTVTYAATMRQPRPGGNGRSTVKIGRVVPIIFELTGASAAVTDAMITMTYAKVTNAVGGTDVQAMSLGASGANRFRYDPDAEHYLYNWATDGLSAGTYLLRFWTGNAVMATATVALE